MAGSEIKFEVDDTQLRKIEKKLGDMKVEAPKVLKNALNYTGRDAKRDLAKKSQETYQVKSTKFTKAMRQKNATTSNLEATIKITGKQLELKDYKASPATFKGGVKTKDAVRAKVLKSSSLKALEIGGRKAFLIKFKSGHVTIAQRKGDTKLPVKKLLSNAIPKMVGSKKRVYGIIEPEIYNNLQKNINSQIEKVLKK